MLTLFLHLDNDDVRPADVPEDCAAGDLLSDVLKKAHPGSPRMDWGLYLESPEQVLSPHKTLAQNGVKNEAHLFLFSKVSLALEVDAPGHAAIHREVAPSTSTQAFLHDLVQHFKLNGLPSDWQLARNGSPEILDGEKTLAANGIRGGDWLSVRPSRAVIGNPLPPAHVTLRIVEPKSGRVTSPTVLSRTLTSALLRDVIDTLQLPATTRTGKTQDWLFVQPNSTESLDLDCTLAANGLKDGSYLEIKPSAIDPELVLKLISPTGASTDIEAESALGAGHLLRSALSGFSLPLAKNGKPIPYRLLDTTQNNKELDLAQTLGNNGVNDGARLRIAPPAAPAIPWRIVAVTALGTLLLAALAWFLLTPSVSVVVTSARQTLSASDAVQLHAEVLHARNPAVHWSLSPRLGHISPDGLYTAPGAIGGILVVRAVATSVEDNSRSGSVDLTLHPASPPPLPQPQQPQQLQQPVATTSSFQVAPATASISPGQARRFVVTPDPGGAVQWQITPQLGRIGPDGVYVAPATLPGDQPQTVTLAAITASGQTALAAVLHLKPHAGTTAPKPDNTALGGITATRDERGQTVFHVTGAGGNAVPVLWSLTPEFGSISPGGVYTPPARVDPARDVTVRATSQANPASSVSYTLHLPATVETARITVTVAPEEHVTLRAGERKTFTATVRGTGNTLVTWAAMGGGNIMPNGLYIAPATVSGGGATVRIRATSNANPAVYGESQITLRAGAEPAVARTGTLLWQGQLKKKQTLTLRNNVPSTGSLSGALPGTPVELRIVSCDCDLITAPSQANGWSVVAVKAKSNQASITLGWTALAPMR